MSTGWSDGPLPAWTGRDYPAPAPWPDPWPDDSDLASLEREPLELEPATEGLAFMRGLLWGALASLVLWAVIIGAAIIAWRIAT